MTSQQQRLEELQQQAKDLTEQIEQLEDQLNNAKPTTGLLGRWVTHPEYGEVLIAEDRATDKGTIHVVYLRDDMRGGAMEDLVLLDDLEFPDQTTRPQDVPIGDAWLIDADDGDASTTNTPAVKESTGVWITGENNEGGVPAWSDNEVTLITPLIPARPHDRHLERVVEGVRDSDGEGHTVEVGGVLIVKCDEYGVPLRRWPEQGLETVTTYEEYVALPEGSVVAHPRSNPWVRLPYMWVQSGEVAGSPEMAGTTRQVLRRGWGE